MKKLLKYVPTGNVTLPVTFPSSEGSVTFTKVGEEKIISTSQYDALMEDKEFQACIDLNVIVSKDITEMKATAGKSNPESTPVVDADSTDNLSAVPRKSPSTTKK